MEYQEYHNLIAKHLKRESTPFEEQLLAEWLQESEDHKAIYEEMTIVWNSASTVNEPLPDVEKAWNRVKQQTGIGQQTEAVVRPIYEVKTFLRIAAMLLLVVGLGYLVKTFWFTQKTWTEIASGDEKKDFYLPDSSHIWLNRNTRLSYSEDYNSKTREVRLEGEAFFEVRKNKEKPFIVDGVNSKTEVLGTSFKVLSVKGQEEVVEVVTGKVAFSSNKNGSNARKILLPGDKATLRLNGTIEQSKSEDPNSLSWKSGQLQFNNVPLNEVTLQMQEYFNVPVIIENPEIKNCLFTGEFEKPDMDMMLNVLSVSFNLSYKKQGNAYILSGGGCK